MAEAPLFRLDLRLIGIGLGALVMTVMVLALPVVFASTQPQRVAMEQSAIQ